MSALSARAVGLRTSPTWLLRSSAPRHLAFVAPALRFRRSVSGGPATKEPNTTSSSIPPSLKGSASSTTGHQQQPGKQPVADSEGPATVSKANQTSSEDASVKASSNNSQAPAVKDKDAGLSRWERIKATVKKEASHYWHGTKLLAKESRISIGLLGALLRGRKLTRREHRQLKRTTQDLLRLIPFSVFVLIPFMELLLPVALKLFPNMLPSTFADKHKEDEKKRKLLKVRIEMAKFLQETLRETGVKSPDKIKHSSEFQEFFRKVRATGQSPSTEDIVRVAKLFDDDLTLENLSRPQLVGMCRYMNINAFGTDNFLRHTIRSRLAHINRDDHYIQNEGVDSLSDAEATHACVSRGIRTSGVDLSKQREALAQWVDMHLHHQLSGVLLILTRAFDYAHHERGDGMDSLRDTLASLPDNLLNVAELQVSDKADYKKRLEVLEEQQELIQDEKEQEQKEAEARSAAKAKEQEEKEAAVAEEEAAKAKAAEPEQLAEVISDQPRPEEQGELQEDLQDLEDPSAVRLTTEQLNELGNALEILSAKSSFLQERADLRSLMEDNLKTEAAANEAGELVDDSTVALGKRVRGMIKKIDKQLAGLDDEVGAKFNMINLSEDRVSARDLRKALLEIRHRPSEKNLDVLIGKLDVDGDGFIPIEDIKTLVEGEGLGTILDEESQACSLLSEGKALRHSPEAQNNAQPPKDKKLKRADVVEE